jgi:hypothetical protein
MTELEKILKGQDRIDKKLTALLNKKETPLISEAKQTWVKVSFVVMLTGWNKRKLYQARQQGLIVYRKTVEKGFEYLVESIPEQFLLKKKSG